MPVIKEDQYKGMMVLNDVLLNRIYFNPERLKAILPDFKRPGVCRIQSTHGKWFLLKHTVLEVQEIYLNTLKQIELDKGG